MYSKSCNDWYVPITCARPKISPDAIIAKVLFMNIFLIVFLYINSSTIGAHIHTDNAEYIGRVSAIDLTACSLFDSYFPVIAVIIVSVKVISINASIYNFTYLSKLSIKFSL